MFNDFELEHREASMELSRFSYCDAMLVLATADKDTVYGLLNIVPTSVTTGWMNTPLHLSSRARASGRRSRREV